MKERKLPLLAAYADEHLNVEAAQQIVRMTEDENYPAFDGENLPEADRAALLRKVNEVLQEN